MSFPRAPIKRFNDNPEKCTPAPTAYDPKLPRVSQGGTFDKSNRFRGGRSCDDDVFSVPNSPVSVRVSGRSRNRISSTRNSVLSSCTLSSSTSSIGSRHDGSKGALSHGMETCQACEQTQEECNQLKIKCESVKTELETFKNEFMALKESMEAVKKELSANKEAFEKHTMLYENVIKERNKYRSDLALMKQSKKVLQSELAASEKLFEENKTLYERAIKERDQYQSDVASIKQSMQALETELSVNKKSFDDNKTMYESSIQERDKCQSDLMLMKQSMDTFQDELSAKQSLLKQQVKQHKLVVQERDQLKLDVSAFNAKIKEVQLGQDEARDQNKVLLALLERKDTECSQLKLKHTKLQEELSSAKSDLGSVTTELTTAKGSLVEYETKLRQFMKERQGIRDNLEKFAAQHTALKDDFGKYKKSSYDLKVQSDEEIVCLKNKLSTASHMTDQMADQLSVSQTRVTHLESLIGPFKEQLECFERERQDSRARLEGKDAEYKELTHKYAQMIGHQNHKQKIQHIIKLKEDRNKYREEAEKMRVENLKLKNKVDKLSALQPKRFDPKHAFQNGNPNPLQDQANLIS